MKIAFLGDSITEGVHGASYIKVLEEMNTDISFSNYGKGGDTVSSLLRRMKKINDLNEYDIIVLFIGINDILGTLSWFYKLLKVIDKQPVAKSEEAFQTSYKSVLEYLNQLNAKIVIIPPLFIGEKIDNKWNIEVTKLVEIIESLIMQYPEMDYINIRKEFEDYLKNKVLSDFVPLKAMDMKQDGDDIRSGKDVDAIGERRGLYLTIDGVHINTLGARMIANSIQMYLSEYNK